LVEVVYKQPVQYVIKKAVHGIYVTYYI